MSGHASTSQPSDSAPFIGTHSVLGKFKGFINVDKKFLMSDEIELLPVDKIGLEILETVHEDRGSSATCLRSSSRLKARKPAARQLVISASAG